MGKIQYENKVALLKNDDIPDINKVKADDMNEIKQVVNENDDKFLTNGLNVSNEVDEDYRVNFLKSKNLFDANKVLNGMGISSGGTITSVTDNGLFYIPVIAGKTYVFSFTDNGVSGNIVWGYTSQVPADGVSCTYNIMTNANLNGATFTPTGTQKYLCIRLKTTANNQYNAMSNIQCEEGSAATSYEPYITPSIYVDNEKIYRKEVDGKGIFTHSSINYGDAFYHKLGNLVIVNIQDLQVSTAISTGSQTKIGEGFPKNISNENHIAEFGVLENYNNGSTAYTIRVIIDTNGDLLLNYSGIPTNQRFYGTFVYITNE